MKFSSHLLLSFFIICGSTALFSSEKKESKQVEPKSYMALRGAAFKTSAKDVGVDPEKDGIRVYGVLMDLAFEKGNATLVSMISGDAALYFNGDGNVIDGGARSSIRIVATKYVQSSGIFTPGFQEVKDYPLPKPGEVRFYLLTPKGVMTSVADEKQLRDGKDYLSPLFFKANEVITELRKMDEGRKDPKK
jgi:hypothetical protein